MLTYAGLWTCWHWGAHTTISAVASATWEVTHTDQLAEQLRSIMPSAICLLEPWQVILSLWQCTMSKSLLCLLIHKLKMCTKDLHSFCLPAIAVAYHRFLLHRWKNNLTRSTFNSCPINQPTLKSSTQELLCLLCILRFKERLFMRSFIGKNVSQQWNLPFKADPSLTTGLTK